MHIQQYTWDYGRCIFMDQDNVRKLEKQFEACKFEHIPHMIKNLNRLIERITAKAEQFTQFRDEENIADREVDNKFLIPMVGHLLKNVNDKAVLAAKKKKDRSMKCGSFINNIIYLKKYDH